MLITNILLKRLPKYPPAPSHTPCASTHLPSTHASAPLQSQSLAQASLDEGNTRSQPGEANSARGGRGEEGDAGATQSSGTEQLRCCDGLRCSVACRTEAAALKCAAAALLLKLLPQRYFGVSECFQILACYLPHISSKAARRQWSIAAPTQEESNSRDFFNSAAATADSGASVDGVRNIRRVKSNTAFIFYLKHPLDPVYLQCPSPPQTAAAAGAAAFSRCPARTPPAALVQHPTASAVSRALYPAAARTRASEFKRSGRVHL